MHGWKEGVREVLEKTLGKKSKRNDRGREIGWDRSLHKLAFEKRRVSQKIKEGVEVEVGRVELKEIRNRIRKKIRKKRRDREAKLVKRLEYLRVGDPKQYWKLAKKFSGLRQEERECTSRCSI